jgi:hypothetical protein
MGQGTKDRSYNRYVHQWLITAVGEPSGLQAKRNFNLYQAMLVF